MGSSGADRSSSDGADRSVSSYVSYRESSCADGGRGCSGGGGGGGVGVGVAIRVHLLARPKPPVSARRAGSGRRALPSLPSRGPVLRGDLSFAGTCPTRGPEGWPRGRRVRELIGTGYPTFATLDGPPVGRARTGNLPWRSCVRWVVERGPTGPTSSTSSEGLGPARSRARREDGSSSAAQGQDPSDRPVEAVGTPCAG